MRNANPPPGKSLVVLAQVARLRDLFICERRAPSTLGQIHHVGRPSLGKVEPSRVELSRLSPTNSTRCAKLTAGARLKLALGGGANNGERDKCVTGRLLIAGGQRAARKY